MSTTDRDAMEREALAEDLHGDCYEGLDPAAKREVDRLLAAGWSRSPRPAAVSEGQIAEVWPHHDYCCAKGCAGHGFCVGCNGTEADCKCSKAMFRAALHRLFLVPGQSEASIRADERTKVLRAAADLLASEGRQHTHMPSDGVRRQTYRRVANRLRGWAGSGMPAARTAPAEDGAAPPIHRTEAGYPNCSTCDGGGCPDCTDPA